MLIENAYIVSGAVTGFLLGLTGVGGGALMTPTLLIFFHLNPIVAVGTDLWFAVITKIVGALVHYQAGQVDWQVVKRLWCGSLTVALITGVYLSIGVHINKINWLSQAIAIVVLITALGIFIAPYLYKIARQRRLTHPARFKSYQAPLTIVLGALVGFCVTLTSIGAGTIGVVVLLYLYPLRMKPHRLVATDLVHAIPLAIIAGTGYLIQGYVDMTILINLLIGSIPAIIISSLLSRKISGRKLQLILAFILLIFGVKILI